jgi:nucleotide-binding universal stress UspA family protein
LKNNLKLASEKFNPIIMYQFKRVLVGLDLTEMDEILLKYASHLVKLLEVEKIYFIHVARSLQLPADVKEKFPDLLAPVDEVIEHRVKEEIRTYFGEPEGCEVKIEVKEGNPMDKILRCTDIKDIDLMVMGRKRELTGSGVLPGKLSKVAHCSIMFVPEDSPMSISKILVPVDFSGQSFKALQNGMLLAEQTGAELLLQNSYEVPTGYHKTGKSFDEFAEIMKKNAEKDFNSFLMRNKVAQDLPCIFTLDKNDNPAAAAYQVAHDMRCDLIIVGSRGRTELASILLGSMAEKMSRYDSEIPLLIVKNKKENMGFLEAILRL